jgi:hypothetical protein
VLAGHLRIGRLVQVQHRHVGAFTGEQHRHGTADAGVGPGDDRALAFQLAAATVVRRKEARRQLQFVLVARLGHLLGRHGLRLFAGTGLGGLFRGLFRRSLLRRLLGHAHVPGLLLVLQTTLARGHAGGARVFRGGLAGGRLHHRRAFDLRLGGLLGGGGRGAGAGLAGGHGWLLCESVQVHGQCRQPRDHAG